MLPSFILLPASLVLVTAVPARAQGGLPDKSVSLGAGVVVTPKPYLDADSEILPLPVIGLRYKAFYFEGIRMGVRGRPRPHLELDGFVQVRFDGYEEDDSPALAGMADRDMSMDAGFGVAGKWDGAEVGLTLLVDALDESGGHELDLSVGFPFEAGRWRLKPSATVAFQSEDLVDHYYGVLPGEATADRPEYAGEDTINLRIGLQAVRPFDSGWSLLLKAEMVAFGDEIKASPIVDDKLGLRARAAAFYTFGR
jgi:outer membrane protein